MLGRLYVKCEVDILVNRSNVLSRYVTKVITFMSKTHNIVTVQQRTWAQTDAIHVELLPLLELLLLLLLRWRLPIAKYSFYRVVSLLY